MLFALNYDLRPRRQGEEIIMSGVRSRPSSPISDVPSSASTDALSKTATDFEWSPMSDRKSVAADVPPKADIDADAAVGGLSPQGWTAIVSDLPPSAWTDAAPKDDSASSVGSCSRPTTRLCDASTSSASADADPPKPKDAADSSTGNGSHPSTPLIDALSSSASTDAPPKAAISAAAGSLSPHEWSGVVKSVVRYLTADEIKCLRLVGGREMRLSDPSLTSHLRLRMDKAPFFRADDDSPGEHVRKWLTNRRRLIIDDVNSRMCMRRVGTLVAQGCLNSVSQVIVLDCHAHRRIISMLTELPNLKSLVLADNENDEEQEVLDDLEFIVAQVGKMPFLRHLDIEFDMTVHGSRLSFLRNLPRLERLRLRGFDMSDGINYIRPLESLKSCHLCHGNFYSSPSADVEEKDLLSLMGLNNLRHVHLEGFDCLTDIGLKPFCTTYSSVESLVLKHCQELSDRCLPSIGRMERLTSLHIIHSAYDDVSPFSRESLRPLNSLSALKSLSLFYVLDDLSDLRALWGLSSLETLNLALEDDMAPEDLDSLCDLISSSIGSLRKLRIFSEDSVGYTCQRGDLEIECAAFNFGDLVFLE
ncbi:hypothetical protein ACHAWF_005233 [Thalassiosira exigua]